MYTFTFMYSTCTMPFYLAGSCQTWKSFQRWKVQRTVLWLLQGNFWSRKQSCMWKRESIFSWKILPCCETYTVFQGRNLWPQRLTFVAIALVSDQHVCLVCMLSKSRACALDKPARHWPKLLQVESALTLLFLPLFLSVVKICAGFPRGGVLDLNLYGGVPTIFFSPAPEFFCSKW